MRLKPTQPTYSTSLGPWMLPVHFPCNKCNWSQTWKSFNHTWLQFLVPLIIVMSITIIGGTENCSQVRLKEFLASLKIKSANYISTSQLPPLHSITVIPSINPLTTPWQLSLFLSQEISLISFWNRLHRPACPILPLVPSAVIVSLSSPHPSVISLTRHWLPIMFLLLPKPLPLSPIPKKLLLTLCNGGIIVPFLN